MLPWCKVKVSLTAKQNVDSTWYLPLCTVAVRQYVCILLQPSDTSFDVDWQVRGQPPPLLLLLHSSPYSTHPLPCHLQGLGYCCKDLMDCCHVLNILGLAAHQPCVWFLLGSFACVVVGSYLSLLIGVEPSLCCPVGADSSYLHSLVSLLLYLFNPHADIDPLVGPLYFRVSVQIPMLRKAILQLSTVGNYFVAPLYCRHVLHLLL